MEVDLFANRKGQGKRRITRGGLDWPVQNISSQKGWSGPGTACPGKWWSPHPFRDLKNVLVWCLGTWCQTYQCWVNSWE